MMNFTDNYVQYLLDIATEINSLSLFLWKDTIVSRNGFCTSLVGEMAIIRAVSGHHQQLWIAVSQLIRTV